MILTEGLVLQYESIWKKFIEKDVFHENNSCELYFEEIDIDGFYQKLKSLYLLSYAPYVLWLDYFKRLFNLERLLSITYLFYSCHCTGEPAYKMMKLSMGEQLQYVHSGDEVKIKKWVAKKEGRSTFMKWHKFFAWATVICFFMTMITGYKKA